MRVTIQCVLFKIVLHAGFFLVRLSALAMVGRACQLKLLQMSYIANLDMRKHKARPSSSI